MGAVVKRFSFKGREALAAVQPTLSKFFIPHLFTLPKNSQSLIVLTSSDLNEGTISDLDISDQSEVSCESAEATILVLVKRGKIHYEFDDASFDVKPGDGVIIREGQSFTRRSEKDGAHLLLVKLQPKQIECHLPFEAIDKATANVYLPQRFNYSDAAGGTLWRSVEFVSNELLRHDDSHPFHDSMVENFEGFLLRTLFETQASVSQQVNDPVPSQLIKAVTFLRNHCAKPLHLEDLCQISGMSARSLNSLFNKHFDRSPMQYLKYLRLHRVHEQLLHPQPGTTITDVALSWGFSQLGWFSKEYRKQFGETPSDTLRHALH